MGLGMNYNQIKIGLYYSNFVNPNLIDGYISSQIKHQYISFPLNLYWKVPLSETSSLYLFSGAESFKTTNIYKTSYDYLHIIKNDGSGDRNAVIANNFKTEKFSTFGIFNAGLKFEFNQYHKNRVALGIHYYLMKNSFSMQNHTMVFAGNKNYEYFDQMNFEGLRFTLGYLW